jgi:glycosyltransferase involved in cell wall biosynthesis
VLHLHSSKAGAVGRIAVSGIGRDAPVVVYTPHAFAFSTQPGRLKQAAYWLMERALARLADCVVALSESERHSASRLCPLGRVVLIPNGVDLPRFMPGPRKARPGELYVGWLGRMTWQKDPKAAVRTSNLLFEAGVAHELLLGGDGPDHGRVAKMINKSHAEERVKVLGFVEDVEAFYDSIDVFLTTSRSEGLPYSGLDAMAHSIPVVGFRVPGIEDMVDDEVTGLLAPPGDFDALTARLIRLARDPGLRRSLGAAARARVLATFRLKDQLDRHCELYEKLLAGRTERRPRP